MNDDEIQGFNYFGGCYQCHHGFQIIKILLELLKWYIQGVFLKKHQNDIYMYFHFFLLIKILEGGKVYYNQLIANLENTEVSHTGN